MKILTLTILFLLSSSLFASSSFKSWKELQVRLERAGGNTKMLKHVKCFMSKGEDRSFEFKKPRNSAYESRCYKKSQYELGNKKTIALIDYTAPANKPRMYVINRQTGDIKKMAVAHGRYKSGFLKRRTKKNYNSVRWAKYFSNQKGSNAPSSGFYLAGQEYYGKWDRSLVLNGLESKVNANACERAVVIHGHKMVSNKKAYTMSSGCPMVSKKNIDKVIDVLKGNGNTRDGLQSTGALVFIYSAREAAWAKDYCGEI